MVLSSSFLRRVAIGLVALMLTLGGVLLQPAALAGFGTSPGPSSFAYGCDSGKHYDRAILTV